MLSSKLLCKKTAVFSRLKYYSKHTRSSHPEVFLEKGVLKICIKFTGEHPCRSAISIKLQQSGWLLLTYENSQPGKLIKVCARYFSSNFYFSPNDSRSKTMKNVFYFI